MMAVASIGRPTPLVTAPTDALRIAFAVVPRPSRQFASISRLARDSLAHRPLSLRVAHRSPLFFTFPSWLTKKAKWLPRTKGLDSVAGLLSRMSMSSATCSSF